VSTRTIRISDIILGFGSLLRSGWKSTQLTEPSQGSPLGSGICLPPSTEARWVIYNGVADMVVEGKDKSPVTYTGDMPKIFET